MKKILFLTIFIALSSIAIAQPLGSKNTSVEVLGGMKVDSAFALPWNYTTFKNKGVDTNGRMFISTTDTLPRYMKKGVSVKTLTQFDSNKVYIAWSQKGVANGVATLDGSGLVPASQIPVITASDTVFIDANMAAMLAHTGSRPGVISVRTDSNLNFILATTPATSRSSWVLFQFGGVVTFNTRGGSVIPRAGDYITDSVAEGINHLYYTNARVQAQIYADSNTIYVTPKMLKDSVSGRVKYSDTATMLSGYARLLALADTASAHMTLINARVKYTDTAAMLSHYLLSYLGVKYSDTASMLAGYRRSTTATALTGEVTGSGTTSIPAKLNRINNNVGTFGNSTNVPTIVVDSTGRISAVVNSAINFPVTQVALDDTAHDIRASMSSFIAPLNDVLTAGFTTNQNMKFGKVKSLSPYSSVFVALNGSDSSGRFTFTDTSGTGVISGATTTANGPAFTVSNNKGSTVAKPSSITMTGVNGEYWRVDSFGIYNTTSFNMGRVASLNPYSSVFVGLGSDSAGQMYLRDSSGVKYIQMVTTTAGSVALNLISPTNNVILNSLSGITTFHLNGNGGTPTILAKGGAGTGSSISITGTDLAGFFTVTIGSGPVLGDTLARITFNTPYIGTPPNYAVVSAGNSNAGALTKPAYVEQADITIAKMPVMSGGATYTTGQQYKFYYQVIK